MRGVTLVVYRSAPPATGWGAGRHGRFSDRVFARAAVAFAVVPVQAAGVVDTGRPCTAATVDNQGRFFFGGWNVGVGRSLSGSVAISHCHCLFVQDPGEQGAKAPCSPLSLHCRIVDFPLSISHCRFSVVVPTGGSCLVRVVRVVAVVPVVTVVRVVAVVAIVDFASSCLPAEVVWRGW